MATPDKVPDQEAGGGPGDGAASAALPQVLADPVFVLGLPASFPSVVSLMLGQHPQLYGLPETYLLNYRTLEGWWEAPPARKQGLLQAVAELYFGGQAEAALLRASGWLRRRLPMSTGAFLEVLAERVYPRVLVDDSGSLAWRPPLMKRAYAMFPEARFLHVLQHPRDFGESVLKLLAGQAQAGPEARSPDLVRLCSSPPGPRAGGEGQGPARPGPGRRRRAAGPDGGGAEPGPKRPGRRRAGGRARRPGAGAEPEPVGGNPDPQWGWYSLNSNLAEFLKEVPPGQVYRVRGEDLLADPDAALPPLARWLGVRDDPEAVEAMKHPERSPFARLGAGPGDELSLLARPAPGPRPAEGKGLEGPLPWRPDGKGFAPRVRQLAQELGYT